MVPDPGPRISFSRPSSDYFIAYFAFSRFRRTGVGVHREPRFRVGSGRAVSSDPTGPGKRALDRRRVRSFIADTRIGLGRRGVRVGDESSATAFAADTVENLSTSANTAYHSHVRRRQIYEHNGEDIKINSDNPFFIKR